MIFLLPPIIFLNLPEEFVLLPVKLPVCWASINLPVTIEEIEKHIIEIAFEKGFVKPQKTEYANR